MAVAQQLPLTWMTLLRCVNCARQRPVGILRVAGGSGQGGAGARWASSRPRRAPPPRGWPAAAAAPPAGRGARPGRRRCTRAQGLAHPPGPRPGPPVHALELEAAQGEEEGGGRRQAWQDQQMGSKGTPATRLLAGAAAGAGCAWQPRGGSIRASQPQFPAEHGLSGAHLRMENGLGPSPPPWPALGCVAHGRRGEGGAGRARDEQGREGWLAGRASGRHARCAALAPGCPSALPICPLAAGACLASLCTQLQAQATSVLEQQAGQGSSAVQCDAGGR